MTLIRANMGRMPRCSARGPQTAGPSAEDNPPTTARRAWAAPRSVSRARSLTRTTAIVPTMPKLMPCKHLNAENPQRPGRGNVEQKANRHQNQGGGKRGATSKLVRPLADAGHNENFANYPGGEHSRNHQRRRPQLPHIVRQIRRRAIQRELIQTQAQSENWFKFR